MNCCFLLEDSKSLFSVLPLWLSHLHFPCTRVANISDISQNNYSLSSGHGNYQLINCVLYSTLEEIIDNHYNIDYFIIIIDSEEKSCLDKYNEVEQSLKKFSNYDKIYFDIKIFVINCCFETWLLGNATLYPKNEPLKDNFFYQYYKHYNTAVQDPEKMPVADFSEFTKAHFHFHYFHEMCRYNKLRYNKSRPSLVQTKEFFKTLIQRVDNTNQLTSFKEFYKYILQLSKQ